MAILHRATIRPTKPEVLSELFGAPVDILGAYRLDDPAGEVGVEGFLLGVDGVVRHTVLTYRGAPLDGADPLTTMEHSVLGTRWIYRGQDDPVAATCLTALLAGDLEQAAEEIWDGDVLVQTREPVVRLERRGEGSASGSARIVDPVADDVAGPHVRATWPGGAGVIVSG